MKKGFSWEWFLLSIVLKDIAGVIVRMGSVMQHATSFYAVVCVLDRFPLI